MKSLSDYYWKQRFGLDHDGLIDLKLEYAKPEYYQRKEVNAMRCVCVECGILYDVKEPFEDDAETHGLCEECFSIVKGNLEKNEEGDKK